MSMSFASFRLKTELSSLQLLPGASLIVREALECKYVSVIEYIMSVEEGIYEGMVLHFIMKIPREYPFKAPKLFCMDPLFHPNVDEDGNVCMEMLRLGWSPGYGLENVFINLHVILIEVSGEDALNTLAGDLFKSDYDRFVRVARGLDKMDK